MERFQIQPLTSSALSGVADFLCRWRENEAASPDVQKNFLRTKGSAEIEQRLRWLTVENPAPKDESPLGFCIRDGGGVIRGLNVAFPAAFVGGEHRFLALGSGSFFVEPQAASMGFFLFKKYLKLPGYAFHFATTCNPNSAALWSQLGGHALPNSDIDYVLPLKLDVMLPALVANRTSSEMAAGLARMSGRCANPVLRLLTRPSTGLSLTPCRDWEKLAALADRHRPPAMITSDRSSAFLRWRYGPDSPLHTSAIYLFRDAQGNEGWFALGNFLRGEKRPFRGSVLLDAVWPRVKMSFQGIFQEILRRSADTADAIFLRSEPGLDYRAFSRFVMPYRLAAPRAFVITPKNGEFSAPGALDLLDYDDSDFGAWRMHWRTEDAALCSGAA